MKINQEKKGDVLILGLKGRLDSNTTGELEKTVIPLIDGGDHKIIIDFCELDYISSAGLRTLLLAAKKLKSVGGKIILCSMKEFIKEIFEMAGFTSIFKIVADLGEAENEVA